jgi:large subunit ribosomal protein L10
MKRAEKEKVVELLRGAFQGSETVILVDFKGINVPDITELRSRIRETGSSYQVVKNTLALRAAQDTPIAEVQAHFIGPTAIAYTSGNVVALAKVLKEFLKTNPNMSLKAAVMEGQPISVQDVEALADMPSKEELLSKLLYLLQAPLARLAGAVQSPLRNLASILKQLEEKQK